MCVCVKSECSAYAAQPEALENTCAVEKKKDPNILYIAFVAEGILVSRAIQFDA